MENVDEPHMGVLLKSLLQAKQLNYWVMYESNLQRQDDKAGIKLLANQYIQK